MTSSCTSMASEVFQWNGADVSNEGKQEKIKEELADVVNYCVLMADACGLDLDEIVWEKIKVNAKKYPVEKAKWITETHIAFRLLPEKFTLRELQQIHETVLDTKLLVPAFRRKVADLVEDTGEMTGDAGHRPAKLYREKR